MTERHSDQHLNAQFILLNLVFTQYQKILIDLEKIFFLKNPLTEIIGINNSHKYATNK